MLIINIIRHGESEANIDKTIYTKKKDQDIEMTEKGFTQAKSIGVELNKLLEYQRADFFISPYKRTKDTFNVIQKEARDYSIFVTENPLLREQEHPVYMSEEEMNKEREKRKEFSLFYHRYPNAESQADVYLRVQTFLNDLRMRELRKEVANNVVIVAHEVVIRMLLMIIDGIEMEKCDVDVPNCTLIRRYY